mmetsp:Transcript_31889/g.54925  ORF Transcript_31889/g.54925 Transcript_31889/m.54925 type:complete len:153 (-) Transcript_31889:2405-2863(-)
MAKSHGNPNIASQSKTLFYHSDGTGRDNYIGFNSGGFFAKTGVMPELPVSRLYAKRRPSSMPIQGSLKKVRYVTNGTGRDMYIASSSGGFECWNRPQNKTTFASMLRVYDTAPQMTQTFTVLDTRTRLQVLNTSKKQRTLTARLSAPKKQVK